MNLIKSFNMNYFKQNVKKSKGLLSIILLLVPIANFLVIFLNSINSYGLVVMETITYMIFNILGMYIVPFIISVALSGYVYKKTSVDFVNSMPLNKKTIFTTNALGGILLIVGMQLINLIIMLIGNLLFNNIVIYPNMMLEIFLEMTISYIFVYMISNIAMSLSGNVITQAIVTALIAFAVPFMIHATNDFFINDEAKIISAYGVIEGNIEENTTFTLPYGIMTNAIHSSSNIINYKVILKTLILSIIYFFIGKYLFEKRKMENTEESFGSEKMHLIVKILTLIPIAYFFESIIKNDFELTPTIIIIVITTIYWCLYDLITKKRINFKKSILYLVLGATILTSIIYVIHGIVHDIREEVEVIEGNKIDKISLDGEYYFKYENVLKDISNETNLNYTSGYSNSYLSKYPRKRIYIKLSDGRIFRAYCNTENLEYNSSIKEGIKREIKEDYDRIIVGSKQITGKQKDEIIEELIKDIDNMDVKKYLSNEGIGDSFELMGYKNHDIYRKRIPIDISSEMFKKITKIHNENSKKEINDEKIVEDGYLSYMLEDFQDNNIKSYREEHGSIKVEQARKFINNHYKEECVMEKPYYILENGKVRFYTNDVEEIKRIINE